MTTPAAATSPDLSTSEARIAEVRRIAQNVARNAAPLVDRDARFPKETIDALKASRMLSAYVPKERGGFGANVEELSLMCEILGQECASSAMVFAMHQIQVACIVQHGSSSSFFRAYQEELVRDQRLIASVTSEAGVGGSVRTSISPILREGDSCTLRRGQRRSIPWR
mgnify:FL=1